MKLKLLNIYDAINRISLEEYINFNVKKLSIIFFH